MTQAQAVTVHAHQPEVLGAEDHDPFTRPRPLIEHGRAWEHFQNTWNRVKVQCQPRPGGGNPEAREAALERFHDAYGYQFDRHGRMKFP